MAACYGPPQGKSQCLLETDKGVCGDLRLEQTEVAGTIFTQSLKSTGTRL